MKLLGKELTAQELDIIKAHSVVTNERLLKAIKASVITIAIGALIYLFPTSLLVYIGITTFYMIVAVAIIIMWVSQQAIIKNPSEVSQPLLVQYLNIMSPALNWPFGSWASVGYLLRGLITTTAIIGLMIHAEWTGLALVVTILYVLGVQVTHQRAIATRSLLDYQTGNKK